LLQTPSRVIAKEGTSLAISAHASPSLNFTGEQKLNFKDKGVYESVKVVTLSIVLLKIPWFFGRS